MKPDANEIMKGSRCTNMRYVQVVDQKTGEVTTIGVKTYGDVADCLREALAIATHSTVSLSVK